MVSRRGSSYRNFDVAVYARVYEVEPMKDPAWLESRWGAISSQLAVDKIYLETHRDLVIASEQALGAARAFFEQRGLRVAGGITLTVNEANRFETFCYTRPEHRAKVRAIAEYSARWFDQLILDDFVFTNCKCESCIQARGDRSWTEFRLELVPNAMRELVIEPARAVRPGVELVIKFPNWYEHFPGTGYDLSREPKLFDRIYTGTETRQPTYNAQHLQSYQSYQIFRYFERIAPGRNGGGWVDTGGMTDADRYAEQIWLTLFAKAPEITLFDLRQLLRPVVPGLRAPFQGRGASFDFDAAVAPFRGADGSYSESLCVARLAGVALEAVDRIIGQLGEPLGVRCYRPHHARGEDFLHDYLGMIGVPIELSPELPDSAPVLLLSEAAAADPAIVEQIERRVRRGDSVCVTSGLLRALRGRGIEHIAEITCAGKSVAASEFYARGAGIFRAGKPIALPVLEYLTNDAWELIGFDANSYPLVIQAGYGKGCLNVLAVPDNFADLYELPAAVLDRLRALFGAGLPVLLEGPSRICLFVYDNDTFLVASFLPEPASIRLVVRAPGAELRDLVSGERLASIARDTSGPGADAVFELVLGPHAHRGFSFTRAGAVACT